MSLFQKREPEVPKKSELSLAIAEKLATGSVMSLGYTQLVEVCRTRYVRGDAIEAQFSVQSPLHNFAFWADLLPSVKSKGPGQMYCSVSDQTADFRAKAERDAGSTTEDRSKSPKTEAHSYLFRESAILPCMFQDCLSLEEQAGLPVRCQETERPNMDLVCGYKSGSTSIKCDCDALRTCQGSQGGILGECNSVMANVKNVIRRHPGKVFKAGASFASAMALGAFCMATAPTCYALAGFETTNIVKPEGLFAGISKTYKCSDTFGHAWSGIKKVIRSNVLARMLSTPAPILPPQLSPVST